LVEHLLKFLITLMHDGSMLGISEVQRLFDDRADIRLTEASRHDGLEIASNSPGACQIAPFHERLVLIPPYLADAPFDQGTQRCEKLGFVLQEQA